MDADSLIGGREPDARLVELAVEVFAMLADSTRVRTMLALRDEELSVNHLAEIVDKSPAAISQHLAKLRLGRFVTTRHEGTHVFHRLENEHARQRRRCDLPGRALARKYPEAPPRPDHPDTMRTPAP